MAIDWLQLKLPWWNPYEATGAPLAGELQSAAFFPPTALTLFSNGQLYERMLLEVLAGISTYLLLRRIPVDRLAATAGGIAFALNGTFGWLSHAPINAVPFLPLLLLGIELAYATATARRPGGWWLIALAGALSFYAGFPEVAYIDSLLAVCWFAWRLGCSPRERRKSLVAKGATGVTVGILLSAPLLVASLGYLGRAELGSHATDAFASLHLPLQALPQMTLPYVYGPIFAFGDGRGVLAGIWSFVGGHLTSSILLFALLGLFSANRKGLRLMLLGFLALALARIYGLSPLAEVLGWLPGMSRIAFLRYAFPSVELAVVILAALGLDELTRHRSPRRRVVLAVTAASLGAVAVSAASAMSLARKLGAGFDERAYVGGSLLWGSTVVVLGSVIVLAAGSRTRTWLAAVVVAADALVLFTFAEASAPRSVHVDRAPVAFLRQHLGTSRFFTLGPLQPNYGSYFGLGQLNVNDIPIPKLFADHVRSRLDQDVDPTVFVGNTGGGRSPKVPPPKQELLRNLNGYREAAVAYVLTPPGEAMPESATSFRLVFRSASTWIYRLNGASTYFTAADADCTLQVANREDVRLVCPHATTLVRRETDLPGWSARVDGKPVAVHRFGDMFQAVSVGSGSHTVTFHYSPPHMRWAFAAFVAGCVWLLFVPLLNSKSEGRRRLGVVPGTGGARR